MCEVCEHLGHILREKSLLLDLVGGGRKALGRDEGPVLVYQSFELEYIVSALSDE